MEIYNLVHPYNDKKKPSIVIWNQNCKTPSVFVKYIHSIYIYIVPIVIYTIYKYKINSFIVSADNNILQGVLRRSDKYLNM